MCVKRQVAGLNAVSCFTSVFHISKLRSSVSFFLQ